MRKVRNLVIYVVIAICIVALFYGPRPQEPNAAPLINFVERMQSGDADCYVTVNTNTVRICGENRTYTVDPAQSFFSQLILLGMAKDEVNNLTIEFVAWSSTILVLDVAIYSLVVVITCAIAFFAAIPLKKFLSRRKGNIVFSGFSASGQPILNTERPIAPTSLNELLPRILHTIENAHGAQVVKAHSDEGEFYSVTATDQSQVYITERKIPAVKNVKFNIIPIYILIALSFVAFLLLRGNGKQVVYTRFLDYMRDNPTGITHINVDGNWITYETTEGVTYQTGIDSAIPLIPQLREWGISESTLNMLNVSYVDREGLTRQVLLISIIVFGVLLCLFIVSRISTQKISWAYNTAMEPIVALSLITLTQDIESELHRLADHINTASPEFTAHLDGGRVVLVYPANDRKLDVIYKPAPSQSL